MKTKEIATAYRLINQAKLTKMDDADKFKVIKAIRVIKPIATLFDESVKDAQEKLKDEKHADMEQRATKWNEKYADANRSDIPDEDLKELGEVNAYFSAHLKLVNDCVSEEANKECDLSYEKLSEEAFSKFISSNDFDVNAIINMQDVLCTI